MTYSYPASQQLSQRVVQPIPRRTRRKTRQNQLLIVCCGNELQGDAAVGPTVAMTVSEWGLASVSAIVVDTLTPNLILALSKADYVIFVEPCDEGDRTRTTQLWPIVVRQPHLETIHIEANQCSPHTLLNLTRQVHDNCPQSWLLKVPTADFRLARKLSSTAKTGIDQALKTITQFLRTYQSPQGLVHLKG